MRPLLLPTRRTRRHSPASLSRFAVLTLLLSMMACLHRRAKGADDDTPPMPLPEFVYVSVENHNWSDMIVWLVKPDGVATRIGTVTGSSNAVLQFRGSFIAGGASLQLMARPVGGRTAVRSERFSVQPGQQVQWTLETSLQRSSLAVY